MSVFPNADWQAKTFSRKDAIECTKGGILEIPEGFESFDCDFAYFVVRSDLPRVHTLIIPQSVKSIETMRGDPSMGPYGYKNNPFREIIVHEKNEHFRSQDGVLFSRDMKSLICYPCGKPDKTYQIPESVEVIEAEAFLNVEHLAAVTFGDSLQCVEERAFTACGYPDFPDLIGIYKRHREIILSFPLLKDSDCRIGGERCYCCLTETSAEPLGEETFHGYCLEGMQPVSDPDERHDVIRRFCSLVEDLQFDPDWTFQFEEFADRIFRFRKVFYNDWY